MNKENFILLRNFSPKFIRDMAFKSNLIAKSDDFKEFYNQVCKFSHPSFVGLGLNNRYNQLVKEDTERSMFFILLISTNIFVRILEKFIDKELKNLFDKIYLEEKTLLLEPQVNASEVRRHFLLCQKSGRENYQDFIKISEEIKKMDDNQVSNEIWEKFSGKPNELNNIFFYDYIKWYKRDIRINSIINPYTNFRGLVNFMPFTLDAKRILELINNQQLINDINKADVNVIKKSLPIFVFEKNGLYFGQDVWFRLLVLTANGYDKVEAFVGIL